MVPQVRPREMKTVQLEWRQLHPAVTGLFGFLLAAMILRQQLEMGHPPGSFGPDPVQRLFLDLGG